MLSLTKNTEICLVLAIAISLNYLPKVGRIFKGFNTLVHESGHAFMSLLLSGEVVSVDILHTGEGVATTKSKSWFTKFMVSIAGYPFSSVVSFAFAYLIYTSHYNYILYVMICLSVINLIFWVRNAYGIIWLIIINVFLFSIFYFHLTLTEYYTALFITAFVFTDAWISSWHILYLSIKEPKKAGDAKNLSGFALLPALFWALFFWGQATFLALMSVQLFYKLPIEMVSRAVALVRSIL